MRSSKLSALPEEGPARTGRESSLSIRSEALRRTTWTLRPGQSMDHARRRSVADLCHTYQRSNRRFSTDLVLRHDVPDYVMVPVWTKGIISNKHLESLF